MALNPLLYNPSQPMSVEGEHFLLSRHGVQCEISVEGLPTLKGSGQLFLTTLRLVFVVKNKVSLGGGMFFEAFDFPLGGLRDEKFQQPIFGANYLQGTVAPLPNGGLPGPASFKLYFRDGGCGTLLTLFLRAMREVRRGNAANRAAGDRGWTLASAVTSGKLAAESSALVDPSDPTVIYVSQPDFQQAKPISADKYATQAS